MPVTYENDFAAWSKTQADLLRRHATDGIDFENVEEEIESLGRSDRREIRSRLTIICEHLLKWRYQPEERSPSWRSSIRRNPDQIAGLIEESPSLASYPSECLAGAYASGQAAIDETGLMDLPELCPLAN